MPALLVDYSFTHPPASAIKAAGYVGVMRYLAPPKLGGAKILTAAERDQLLLGGLSVGLVWETYSRRAAAGQAAGEEDAKEAEAMARALGVPADVPIFYAVDFDTTASAVAAYFAGVRAAATRPRGVYGGIKVVDPLMAADRALCGWQACAWSGGKVSQRAHLYQRQRATVRRPLAGTDENVLLRPLPFWTLTAHRGASAPTAPPAPVQPQSTPPAPAPEVAVSDVASQLAGMPIGGNAADSPHNFATALYRMQSEAMRQSDLLAAQNELLYAQATNDRAALDAAIAKSRAHAHQGA